MKMRWLLLVTLVVLAACPGWARKAPSVQPELSVLKKGFVLGEDIEFTLNVKGLTPAQMQTLPPAKRSGQVIVETPDGKRDIYNTDLRYQGIHSSFILGTNFLAKQTLLPGLYKLTFEYGGQRSATAVVAVADIPIVRKIKVTLHLDPAGQFPEGLGTAPLTLTVRNDTDTIIHFPRLTGMQGLSFSERGKQGDWENSTFDTFWCTPRRTDILLNFDTFTWDAAEALPTVALRPGDSFEQQISLQPALASYLEAHKDKLPVPPGQYLVTLTQTLNVLIGDRNGPMAAFYPVHIPVKVEALFTNNAHIIH